MWEGSIKRRAAGRQERAKVSASYHVTQVMFTAATPSRHHHFAVIVTFPIWFAGFHRCARSPSRHQVITFRVVIPPHTPPPSFTINVTMNNNTTQNTHEYRIIINIIIIIIPIVTSRRRHYQPSLPPSGAFQLVRKYQPSFRLRHHHTTTRTPRRASVTPRLFPPATEIQPTTQRHVYNRLPSPPSRHYRHPVNVPQNITSPSSLFILIHINKGSLHTRCNITVLIY